MKINVPNHVAIILDGNRRWARKRGLPTLEGHRVGYQKVKEAVKWSLERGIQVLTVWVFSTENWNRSKEEVSYLMNLLKYVLSREVSSFDKQGVRLVVTGQREKLSPDILDGIASAAEATARNTKMVLNIAFNYGGRAEVLDAVKKIVKEKIGEGTINESVVAQHLYSPSLPDPDLIIRTSGEMRLSGFMIWQAAYSELYFCDAYWPDFSEADFDAALREYAKRQRRFGK